MSLTINGKFVQNLPTTEGESQRGHWMRGGFVIEYGEEYPRKAAFTTFGEDKVNQHKNLPAGMPVQVKFSPESREFNEKWYTDLRASRIQPFVPGQMPAAGGYAWQGAAPVAGAQPAAAPAQPAAPAAAAAPAANFAAAPQMASNPDDDLPF